jgi:hypothetical protein
MEADDTKLIRDDGVPQPGDHERAPGTVTLRALPSSGRTGAFATGGGRGKMRASDADRDRVAELLGVAYSEGRLSKDEYDGRLENAFSARTYADLDQLTSDLPVVRRAAAVTPVTKINGLAVASLACGLAQFAFGPLATIPAIVFGHMARHQIKRTGEQGTGLALAGLILGWAAAILGVLIVVAALAAGIHGTMPVH